MFIHGIIKPELITVRGICKTYFVSEFKLIKIWFLCLQEFETDKLALYFGIYVTKVVKVDMRSTICNRIHQSKGE